MQTKKNRKEDKQINFRVSEDEYQKLKTIADSFGMSISAYCKSRSKNSKLVAPKIDYKGAIEITLELRRIGTNVNQIAKHVNSGKNVTEGQLDALQGELNNIWQLLSLAVQK